MERLDEIVKLVSEFERIDVKYFADRLKSIQSNDSQRLG